MVNNQHQETAAHLRWRSIEAGHYLRLEDEGGDFPNRTDDALRAMARKDGLMEVEFLQAYSNRLHN